MIASFQNYHGCVPFFFLCSVVVASRTIWLLERFASCHSIQTTFSHAELYMGIGRSWVGLDTRGGVRRNDP